MKECKRWLVIQCPKGRLAYAMNKQCQFVDANTAAEAVRIANFAARPDMGKPRAIPCDRADSFWM